MLALDESEGLQGLAPTQSRYVHHGVTVAQVQQLQLAQGQAHVHPGHAATPVQAQCVQRQTVGQWLQPRRGEARAAADAESAQSAAGAQRAHVDEVFASYEWQVR